MVYIRFFIIIFFSSFINAQADKKGNKQVIEIALNTANVSIGSDSLYINLFENRFPIMIDNNIRPYIMNLSNVKVANKKVIFKEPEYFALHLEPYYLFFNTITINKKDAFIAYVKLDKDKAKHKMYEITLKKRKKWKVVEKKIIHKSPYMSTHIGMIIYRFIQYAEERRNKKTEKTDLEIEKELLQQKKN